MIFLWKEVNDLIGRGQDGNGKEEWGKRDEKRMERLKRHRDNLYKVIIYFEIKFPSH